MGFRYRKITWQKKAPTLSFDSLAENHYSWTSGKWGHGKDNILLFLTELPLLKLQDSSDTAIASWYRKGAILSCSQKQACPPTTSFKSDLAIKRTQCEPVQPSDLAEKRSARIEQVLYHLNSHLNQVTLQLYPPHGGWSTCFRNSLSIKQMMIS